MPLNKKQELSFEWPLFRISSEDAKVRTRLAGIINGTQKAVVKQPPV